MKKALFALFMVLLLVCAGCSQSTENTGTGSAEGESAAATPRPELPEQATTLMVYMVGSDLEAKVGAATADLEEMANSGIDLSKHNVVVYAGGTPGWHNEVADPQKNTVLRLTESGFTEVASFPNVSMGDSRCLTEFLSYAAENYPAERYALILWDHGNGPVMGYGKDIRHQGDGLLAGITLS